MNRLLLSLLVLLLSIPLSSASLKK